MYYEGKAKPAFKAKIGKKKHLEVYLHIKVSFTVLKACMLCKFFHLLQCSVTCGRGQQTRRVDCRSRSNMRLVLPDSFCEPELRPVNMKLCIERYCPPSEVGL